MARDLTLGVREDGSQYRLPLPTALRHALLVGPTGCGKSGSLVGLALSALQAGVNVVVLDPKGDLAQVLREVFVPVMAERGTLDIRPKDVVTVTAFRGKYTAPQDPLVPIPGLVPSLQAHLVARLLAVVLRDSTMGIRMIGIATKLFEAAIEVGLDFIGVRRCLLDEDYRLEVAGRVREPDLARYLGAGGGFERESTSSREAVRARLDALLRVPALAEALCARSAIPVREYVDSKLVLCDLGDPPQGSLATVDFIAGFLWQQVVAGVFSRPSNGNNKRTLIIVDEAPLVLAVGAEEAEHVLSLARSRGISIIFACQTLAQIRHAGPVLLESMRANVHRMGFFRPTSEDLAEVRDLLPVTGEAIDPRRPDQVLRPEAERAAHEARLRQLPERHYLNVDHLEHELEVLRTPDIPFEAAARAADALPDEVRDAYARGRYGVPRGAGPSGNGGTPPKSKPPRGPRPKLVLP